MVNTFKTEDEKHLVQMREKKKRKRKLIFLSIVIGIFVVLGIIIISTVAGLLKANKEKEVENTTTTEITEVTVIVECPEPWIKVNSYCFMFLSQSCPLGCPWSTAAELCNNSSGILAEPKDPAVLEDLIEYAGNPDNNITETYYWIGLRYDRRRQVFVWASDEKKLDEKINDAGFWLYDKPSFTAGFGIHVYMKRNDELEYRIDNKQNDIITSKPICQKYENHQNRSRINETECTSPWKFHSGECFMFMKESCPYGCSWEEANTICKGEKDILAEPDFYITTDEDGEDGRDELNDYEFLKNLADQTLPISNWWIGITDRETEGTFKKESNQELSKNIANFFDKKKPSTEKKGKKDCLYIRKGLKHSNCNKMVDKKERDFLPQPLCMMQNMDKV